MSNTAENINQKTGPSSRTGVLITNLGTPDAPSVTAVRKYLAEFLSDPRVIKLPRPLWLVILYCFILPFRPARSAHAYSKIWTSEGSPLLNICRNIAGKLQDELDKIMVNKYEVVLGMRYGNPSINNALEKLRQGEHEQIIILPLYPQYSETTTESTFDAIRSALTAMDWQPSLTLIENYHDNPDYINALATSIRQHRSSHGTGEKLLFSFHGIPKQYADEGDPYPLQCGETAHLVAESLKLSSEEWIMTFQSRFGPKKWLQPYTDVTLKALGRGGIKSVDVISPGFSADCLETLEEINMQNRQFFLDAGGEKFSYIPCLNDHPSHIEAISRLILEKCQRGTVKNPKEE